MTEEEHVARDTNTGTQTTSLAIHHFIPKTPYIKPQVSQSTSPRSSDGPCIILGPTATLPRPFVSSLHVGGRRMSGNWAAHYIRGRAPPPPGPSHTRQPLHLRPRQRSYLAPFIVSRITYLGAASHGKFPPRLRGDCIMPSNFWLVSINHNAGAV